MRIKPGNIFLLLGFLTFGLKLDAQQNVIDSLKIAFKNAKHDTTRCNILSALIEAETNEQAAGIYNEQLIKITNKNLDSINSQNSSNKIFYKKHLANSLNMAGIMYHQQGNIPKALEFYLYSLKIQEEINNKEGVAYLMSDLGVVYNLQGDSVSALKFYFKSLKIGEEIKDRRIITLALGNIASMYVNGGDYPKALEYYYRSLKIEQELNDEFGIAVVLNNIGGTLADQGNLQDGLDYLMRSLKILEKNDEKRWIAYTTQKIASVLYNMKRIEPAKIFAERSLVIAKKLGYPTNIQRAASLLRRIYKKQNKFKEALEMYEIEIQMQDSIANQETRKASIKELLKYEYEKKAAADSVKNAEQQKVKNAQLTAQHAQLKQKKTQRYFLIGGMVFVVCGLTFVVNRFRITRRQKKIIEDQKLIVDEAFEKLHEKNKEVMDSIYYARRIQRALITSEKYMERNLNKMNQQ